MGRQHRSSGFSLIELLAVVFILGVGLTSVSMLFVAGIVSGSKSQRMSIATHAGQKQMEMIRSAGFAGCMVDPDVFPTSMGYTILEHHPTKEGRVGFLVAELPNGQGEIEIRPYHSATGYYPNLRTVTITITWGGGGVTKGRTKLQTFIANQP